MIIKILIAWGLVVTTVTIHSTGMAVILWLLFRFDPVNTNFMKAAWRLNSLVWWIIVIHMVEISVWGLFYWYQDCFPSINSALYFAGITYTTIGYGDLLLPQEWRMLAPVQGLTGILMCGLSTAVFFAVVSYLTRMRIKFGKG